MLNYISCKLLSKLYPSMANLSPDAHQQGITQTCASESPRRHSVHWHGLSSCSQLPCQYLIRKHAFMTETNTEIAFTLTVSDMEKSPHNSLYDGCLYSIYSLQNCILILRDMLFCPLIQSL